MQIWWKYSLSHEEEMELLEGGICTLVSTGDTSRHVYHVLNEPPNPRMHCPDDHLKYPECPEWDPELAELTRAKPSKHGHANGRLWLNHYSIQSWRYINGRKEIRPETNRHLYILLTGMLGHPGGFCFISTFPPLIGWSDLFHSLYYNSCHDCKT